MQTSELSASELHSGPLNIRCSKERRYSQTHTYIYARAPKRNLIHELQSMNSFSILKLQEILRSVLSWLLSFSGKGKEIINEGRKSIIGIAIVFHWTVG